MNQGDIILVKYPFSNLTDYKIRPAIVVSKDEFNLKYDVLACSITSKSKDARISLNGSLSEGELDKDSYVNPTKITPLSEETILQKIGKIKREKLKEVIEAIKRNF